MKIINSIENFEEKLNTSIALGTFDGVHLAHKAVIEEAVNSDYVPAVFTFNQSPGGVIGGNKVASIAPKSVKFKLLENLGVKYCFSLDFLQFKDMTPPEFVALLKEKLGVKKITCGFNFRFGLGAKGNPQLLKELCKKFDIEISVIPPVLLEGEPVSSTRIRALIEQGEMAKAKELLGHEFSYDFEVKEGKMLGRELGVPTINQIFPNNFIVPKFGVYASNITIENKTYKGITNIGVKPTVGGEEVSSETNIFGFSGDLYGQNIEVSPRFFIRPERKFADVEELKRAILNDIEYAKDMVY